MSFKETVDNKAQIRAWLFRMLAELEIFSDAYGEKTELDGNKVIIEIQFKS